MNIATTEFLPNAQPAYHGRSTASAINDQHTENTFRWPHGISERGSSTTNQYNQGTDRSVATTSDSHRFDFRCMSEPYRYPYESNSSPQTRGLDIPSPVTSVQQEQQHSAGIKYNFHENQYQKNDFRSIAASNPTAPGGYFKKETQQQSTGSSEIELPFQEQRSSYPDVSQIANGLTLPPPPPTPLTASQQQSSSYDQRYPSSMSNFQTTPYSNRPPPPTTTDSRVNYNEENLGIRSRGYMLNFENQQFPSPQTQEQQPDNTNTSRLPKHVPVVPPSLPNHVGEAMPKSHGSAESKPMFGEELHLQHQLMQQRKPAEGDGIINSHSQQERGRMADKLVNNEGMPSSTAEHFTIIDQTATKSSATSTTKQIKSEQNGLASKSSGSPQNASGKSDSTNQDNGLPSYTAMIAQAILEKESSKSTLSDIYEYMQKQFPSLEKRGTGWRNCVRHTLSLNDCFIKLHRPENGRSCNWAIHPTYYESFSRGDYRKRRALRKRPRGLQWIDPAMLAGYPFVRGEHDVYSEMHQQASPFYHYPTPQHTPNGNVHPASPQGYYHTTNFNQNFSLPPAQPPQTHNTSNIQHYPPPPPHQNYPPQSGTHHLPSAHCTNPDCYCQYSKQTNNRVYTP